MGKQTYALMMEDVVFGSSTCVGVLDEEGCDRIVDTFSVGGPWMVCSNGCCHSKAGAGDFEPVIFKRVPVPSTQEGVAGNIDSLRDSVADIADAAIAMTALGGEPEELN